MLNTNQILETNKALWQDKYAAGQEVMKYPADHIVRFYFHYLRRNIPGGRIFDYGCGSANNCIFFMQQGYEVYGVDTAETSLAMIQDNLEMYHIDPAMVERFSVIPTEFAPLPFEDQYFDVIVSNQTLYYLASEEHIKKICKELSRVLRPGGVVFFTMCGPQNQFIKYHTKQIHNGRVHEIWIDDPTHRIAGSWGLAYLVRDEEELVDLFSEFECLTTGRFELSMFDSKSNFHWIFVGRKRS